MARYAVLNSRSPRKLFSTPSLLYILSVNSHFLLVRLRSKYHNRRHLLSFFTKCQSITPYCFSILHYSFPCQRIKKLFNGSFTKSSFLRSLISKRIYTPNIPAIPFTGFHYSRLTHQDFEKWSAFFRDANTENKFFT